jgi:hypothetical protein
MSGSSTEAPRGSRRRFLFDGRLAVDRKDVHFVATAPRLIALSDEPFERALTHIYIKTESGTGRYVLFKATPEFPRIEVTTKGVLRKDSPEQIEFAPDLILLRDEGLFMEVRPTRKRCVAVARLYMKVWSPPGQDPGRGVM